MFCRSSRAENRCDPLDSTVSRMGHLLGDAHVSTTGVLGKLQDGEAGRVLVVQDDEVVGIITPSDLARWLRRWRTLEGSAR